jgi:hypothetical protein
LSNFPKSNGIFLGPLMLGEPDVYKTRYNVRIDYYMIGYTPVLEIKAFNSICDETFDVKVYNRKMIKDIIRICN